MYSYMLSPVDKYGVEGVKTVVSAESQIPPYTIEAPVMVYNDQDGVYEISIRAKNNQIGDGLKIEAIACIYKGNVLNRVVGMPLTVEKKDELEAADTFTLNDIVKQDGETTVKVFVLDSISDLNIMLPCTLLNF